LRPWAHLRLSFCDNIQIPQHPCSGVDYVMFGKGWAIRDEGWFELESRSARDPHFADPRSWLSGNIDAL
jgi:hypothetical protein